MGVEGVWRVGKWSEGGQQPDSKVVDLEFYPRALGSQRRESLALIFVLEHLLSVLHENRP